MNNNYIVIMAGGVGSRFWPASRKHTPKQFLDILKTGRSLIQMTFDRSLKIVPASQIIVVTNKIYAQQVAEHLPLIPTKNILCEPSRNNTAPCIAYAALHIKAENPDANFAVVPADALIKKEEQFGQIINSAFNFSAEKSAIITLGITPTHPNTGYGYIEFDKDSGATFSSVQRFTEKPDLDTAKSFIAAGNFLWNAGIFIWNVNTLLDAYSQFAPEILSVLCANKELFGTEKEQAYIDEVYPNTPNISVDYAIMEKSTNIYTISADIDWSDLGAWNAVYEELDKDTNGNALLAENPVLEQVNNSLIKTYGDKKIVIKGLEDYIIIDEPDVLLIFPKKDEQDIKQIRSSIEEDKFL